MNSLALEVKNNTCKSMCMYSVGEKDFYTIKNILDLHNDNLLGKRLDISNNWNSCVKFAHIPLHQITVKYCWYKRNLNEKYYFIIHQIKIYSKIHYKNCIPRV